MLLITGGQQTVGKGTGSQALHGARLGKAAAAVEVATTTHSLGWNSENVAPQMFGILRTWATSQELQPTRRVTIVEVQA